MATNSDVRACIVRSRANNLRPDLLNRLDPNAASNNYGIRVCTRDPGACSGGRSFRDMHALRRLRHSEVLARVHGGVHNQDA